MKLNRDLYETYFKKTKELYRQPVLAASVEVILGVFSVSFMIMFAIMPTLSIVANLQKQIDDQKIFEQKVDSKIIALNLAQVSLTKNADKLPLYKSAVPYEHHLDQVSQRIEKIAQESGVAVKSLQFTAVPLVGDDSNIILKGSEANGKGQTRGVLISFHLEGKSEAILKMIDKMQHIDRLVFVETITLSKQEKGSISRLITASGKAEIYYEAYLNKQK